MKPRKREERTYVILRARFKPARVSPTEGEFFVIYFDVAGEVKANAASIALRRAKELGVIAPIVEEKQSFWARIEAAKVHNAARRATARGQIGAYHE